MCNFQHKQFATYAICNTRNFTRKNNIVINIITKIASNVASNIARDFKVGYASTDAHMDGRTSGLLGLL